MKFYLLILPIILGLNAQAQNILIDNNGGTPDASAMLEVRSTDKGMLVPRMLEVNRLGILSPAQGLLVFQTNGLVGFYYHNGTNWDTLVGSTVINVSNITNTTNSNIAVIQDLKASGVDGGDFDNGAWRTRDLNTLTGDVSFISLGTNTFTLDSGIYILNSSAPARQVSQHQTRLYNITSGAVEAVGTAVTSAAASPPSKITTIINVTTSTNTFRIEHQCEDTRADDGFGEAVTWGNNVYTQIWIQKL